MAGLSPAIFILRASRRLPINAVAVQLGDDAAFGPPLVPGLVGLRRRLRCRLRSRPALRPSLSWSRREPVPQRARRPGSPAGDRHISERRETGATSLICVVADGGCGGLRSGCCRGQRQAAVTCLSRCRDQNHGGNQNDLAHVKSPRVCVTGTVRESCARLCDGDHADCRAPISAAHRSDTSVERDHAVGRKLACDDRMNGALVPQEGLEPPTPSLRMTCSTS